MSQEFFFFFENQKRQHNTNIGIHTNANRNQDERNFISFLSATTTVCRMKKREKKQMTRLYVFVCADKLHVTCAMSLRIILLTHSIENVGHALWSRSAKNSCKVKFEKTLDSCCQRLCVTSWQSLSFSFPLSVYDARDALAFNWAHFTETHDECDYITSNCRTFVAHAIQIEYRHEAAKSIHVLTIATRVFMHARLCCVVHPHCIWHIEAEIHILCIYT